LGRKRNSDGNFIGHGHKKAEHLLSQVDE
jgi:hypothetical protein